MPNRLLNALGFVKALAHKRGLRNLVKGKGITGLNAVKRLTDAERMEGDGVKKRQVLKFKM